LSYLRVLTAFFCKSNQSSVSQSGRNRALGGAFVGQGSEKTKGAIEGQKNTKGAKMFNH